MKTLIDFNRRDINFKQSKVSEVLPEHYLSEYPTLITFLDKYYDFMDSDSTYNFAAAIHGLYEIRDVEDANISYIDNILKELGQGILNQNFFLEPRFAMKLISQFYRVKGSLYSSEGFFRAFYRSEIEISYPKRNIFIVGESEIGAESLRYIQDGALYQIYSILVKSEIPLATWQELYKAFVHPAGFYLGAETLLIGIGDLDLNTMPDTIADSSTPVFEATAINSLIGSTEITEIATYGSTEVRMSTNEAIAKYQNLTIQELTGMYKDIETLIEDTSPTFDGDSSGAIVAIDLSNTIETFDQNRSEVWDSDSDAYQLQIS